MAGYRPGYPCLLVAKADDQETFGHLILGIAHGYRKVEGTHENYHSSHVVARDGSYYWEVVLHDKPP